MLIILRVIMSSYNFFMLSKQTMKLEISIHTCFLKWENKVCERFEGVDLDFFTVASIWGVIYINFMNNIFSLDFEWLFPICWKYILKFLRMTLHHLIYCQRLQTFLDLYQHWQNWHGIGISTEKHNFCFLFSTFFWTIINSTNLYFPQ